MSAEFLTDALGGFRFNFEQMRKFHAENLRHGTARISLETPCWDKDCRLHHECAHGKACAGARPQFGDIGARMTCEPGSDALFDRGAAYCSQFA